MSAPTLHSGSASVGVTERMAEPRTVVQQRNEIIIVVVVVFVVTRGLLLPLPKIR
jgi:hypothetical protein